MTSITMRHERHEHHHARRRSPAHSHHITSHITSHHITSLALHRSHRTMTRPTHSSYRSASTAILVRALSNVPIHVPPTSYLLPTSYSLLPTSHTCICNPHVDATPFYQLLHSYPKAKHTHVQYSICMSHNVPRRPNPHQPLGAAPHGGAASPSPHIGEGKS